MEAGSQSMENNIEPSVQSNTQSYIIFLKRGDYETIQTIDGSRHTATKELVLSNNGQKIQTIPYGFFEVWLAENRDSKQNVFPVLKLPKIERLNREEKLN